MIAPPIMNLFNDEPDSVRVSNLHIIALARN